MFKFHDANQWSGSGLEVISSRHVKLWVQYNFCISFPCFSPVLFPRALSEKERRYWYFDMPIWGMDLCSPSCIWADLNDELSWYHLFSLKQKFKLYQNLWVFGKQLHRRVCNFQYRTTRHPDHHVSTICIQSLNFSLAWTEKSILSKIKNDKHQANSLFNF